jgi:hypothetical protein
MYYKELASATFAYKWMQSECRYFYLFHNDPIASKQQISGAK